MKIPRFSNAIGSLDEDLVEAAAECKKKKQNLWLKWSSKAEILADHTVKLVAQEVADDPQNTGDGEHAAEGIADDARGEFRPAEQDYAERDIEQGDQGQIRHNTVFLHKNTSYHFDGPCGRFPFLNQMVSRFI